MQASKLKGALRRAGRQQKSPKIVCQGRPIFLNPIIELADFPLLGICSTWVHLFQSANPRPSAPPREHPQAQNVSRPQRVISAEECPRIACTVSSGVFTASSSVAFA